MALTIGTQLGSHEITALLGKGGMGEVYRARDLKLKREVAIKILPEEFSRDADRVRRFQREAEVLASLNHPNIAAIYDLQEAEGSRYLVLELVEGDTLADRIARSPIPIDEALVIAKQIAEALEVAHEKGVIHRDLKPGNVMLTSEQRVKILDFGLAKAYDANPTNTTSSNSPTMTGMAATNTGVILGTAAYMAPEQARGRTVDRRADIWGLGCVLYELLAGTRAFGGDTLTDVLAAVVKNEPDMGSLPADTPLAIRSLLRRCLQKEPVRRLQHIGDVRVEIDDVLAAPLASLAVPGASAGAGVARAVPWTIAAVLAVVVVGLGVRLQMREPERVARPLVQLEMSLPSGVDLFQGSSQEVAFSPAGTHVAFVGNFNGAREVYVRDLGGLDAVVVRGSENAFSCFFSPTGDEVGFITDRGLHKASLKDKLVTLLARDALNRSGGTWGPDGRVTFARTNGLWQVAAAGGTSSQLTTLTAGESLHAWPTAMNDGKTILFTSVPSGGVQRARIEAVVVDTGKRQVLIENARYPRYASSGHLVFFRDGGLYAVPFDAGRLAVTGQPMAVAAAVQQDASGAPLAEVSSAGSLIYGRDDVSSAQLVWVSRQGVEQLLTDTPRAYLSPRLSADKLRVAVGVGGDLWIQDTIRSTFTRLTAQQSETATYPVWTPDGKQIVFKTPTGLHSIDTDGSGQSRTIAGSTTGDFPSSISPDSRTLAVARLTAENSADVYVLSLTGDPAPRALVTSPAFEGGPQFSPDGHWIAYVSNESGQFQVYLRPYPGPDRRWQVSTDGGTSPLWNYDGKELFYRNGKKMMAVFVSKTPDLTLATPRVIFEQRYGYGNTTALTNYDVSADGQRFLMVKGESGVASLSVVLNWTEELKRLVPARK
jgi:Tol biopolymer transport system component